ncbi:hypothetical protein D3C76_1227860 [compost metagenome]
MKSLGEKMTDGEQLMQQAMQAIRTYQEAINVMPTEEVERLRQEAEFLVAAMTQYNLRVLGGSAPRLH